MKEVKFRAWSGFVYHMYYDEDNIEELGLWDIKDCVNGGKLENTKSLILMQYTGIEDFKGTEIYEGDILFQNLKERGYPKEIVEYNPEKCAYCGRDIKTNKLNTTPAMHCINVGYYVIGNKYENPELLEEK